MTDADDAEREILTWERFGEATRDLARSVADAGFRADLVLSVARGGLTVGGALAYALSVKNCATINVEFYTGVDERLPVPVVLPPVLNPVDVTGLKVLVADDVADSGRTLELVRKVVDEHVAEVPHGGAVPEAPVRHRRRLRVAAHRPLDQLPVVVAGSDRRPTRRRRLISRARSPASSPSAACRPRAWRSSSPP